MSTGLTVDRMVSYSITVDLVEDGDSTYNLKSETEPESNRLYGRCSARPTVSNRKHSQRDPAKDLETGSNRKFEYMSENYQRGRSGTLPI